MFEKNLEAWSLKNVVDFYVHERTRVADLYESESSMLLPVIHQIKSVLDVGCGVGNFCRIFKELNPGISYKGVDTSKEMVLEARKRHPDAQFQLADGTDLPFDDDSFDLVFCTGVVHHNPDFLDMIAEMFRVTNRFAVIDLPRLVTQPYVFDLTHSHMILKKRFPSLSEGIIEKATKVPYVLANVKEALEGLIERLGGMLSGFACCGYYGKPHNSVSIPYLPVIFTVTLLVKGKGPMHYCLSLPDDALLLSEGVLSSAKGIKVKSVEAVIMADEA